MSISKLTMMKLAKLNKGERVNQKNLNLNQRVKARAKAKVNMLKKTKKARN